ncbi:hypothetical protein ABVT39_014496 [Epinephelus coioides]
MAQGYNWDSVIPLPWSSSSGSSSSHSDTSSLLGDTMDEGYTWTSLLVPNPDRPDSPRLILRRVPAPASPSGSPSGGSDTSSLLEDTMEDIPWASLLAPLPRPISPLREPVPPRGCDPEMAQGYNWDSVIPLPWSSSSGSSSGDSDTSSLLGDSMDEGYTWTSLLVPNPDRPDSPRLILRRVPAPASPSGSPSGGSDTSSLLEETMEDIPWASLLAPLPRPISPLREPAPPRGRDPEVGASDPPPAPGKPVEAGPSKGPVAPGISKCCVKDHPAIKLNLTCQDAELHPPERAFLLPTGLNSC